jgi:hypothetical protein
MVSQLQDKTKLLIIPYYEGWDSLMKQVNEIIFEVSYTDWKSVGERLSKYFHWEYDHYNNK